MSKIAETTLQLFYCSDSFSFKLLEFLKLIRLNKYSQREAFKDVSVNTFVGKKLEHLSGRNGEINGGNASSILVVHEAPSIDLKDSAKKVRKRNKTI